MGQAFLEYLQSIGWWGIADLIMILLVAVAIIAFFIKKRSVRVSLVFISFVIVAMVVNFLYYFTEEKILYVTKTITNYVGIFIIVLMCVVYQNDFKALVARIAKQKKDYSIHVHDSSEDELRRITEEIIKALVDMSKNDVGALIVICPTSIGSNILDSGTALNATLSAPLLESIFNPKTPLHDGAVIVKGNTILAAGCFLPLSESTDISKELGTRHRAAKGIAEISDVLVLVVSEETGIISIAKGAELVQYMTIDKLREAIRMVYGINDITVSENNKKKN